MYRSWKPIYEKNELSKKSSMIHKVSSGLLGSTFSWDDVQMVIDNEFNGSVKLGNQRRIVPFAVGIGLQSLLGIIDGDWIIENNSKIPDSILLKIGSPLAMIDALAGQAGNLSTEDVEMLNREFVKFIPPCHNSEIFFYQNLRKLNVKIDQIPKYFFGSQLFPVVDGFSKGCIGIEYIRDVTSMNPAQNFSEFQIKQVLKILAKLQAAFLSASDYVKNSAPHRGFSELFTIMTDWFVEGSNFVMSNIPHPSMKMLAEQLAQKLPEIITSEEIDQIPERLGIPKVFAHGDLWPGNLLWKEENLVKMVDFQMIHFGLAATDLTRFFNSCLSFEDRNLKWKDYLKYFHDCLLETLSDVDDQPISLMPYTYDQLELTYRLVYPRTTSFLLPPFAAILDKIVKMEDGEHKSSALNTLISKIVGMYSDIIEMHENRPQY